MITVPLPRGGSPLVRSEFTVVLELLRWWIGCYVGRIYQALMVGVSVVAGLTAFVWGAGAVMDDRAVSVAVGLYVLSHVGMLVVRLVVERPGLKKSLELFDLRTQAWAFVLGDSLLLTVVVTALTRGWQPTGFDSQFANATWMQMSFVAGFLGAMAFRYGVDKPRYERFDAMDEFHSPTKLWHDFAVFPAVLGVILWAAAPQVLEPAAWNFHTSVAVVLLLCFMALNIRDDRAKVNPKRQHPAWDKLEFAPIY